MSALLGHLLLALAWVALTGDFRLGNFAAGWFFGLLVLAAVADVVGARDYLRRLVAAAQLAAAFGWELLVANARLAHDVLTPRLRAAPAIIGVELDARGDLEVLLLTMLVTLTPGSVAIHVTHDRRTMFVYTMYASDPERERQRLKRVFERRVLAVTRGSAA